MKRLLIFVLLLASALALIVVGLRLRSSYDEAQPQPAGLRVTYRPLRSVAGIKPLGGPLVRPVTYTRVVSLGDLPVREKKRKFFSLLLPSVLIVKHRLAGLRAEVSRLDTLAALDADERRWLEGLRDRYRADDNRELLLRLQDHPSSVVLAQAAIESGWGTSRFYREANNVFGIWSFDEDEPRLAARHMRGNRRVYVKRYRSLLGSIEDYFLTIGRGPYADFRRARARSDDPLRLVDHLLRYSELGEEYVRRVALTIRSNDLHRFDDFRLDPRYLAPEGD